MMMDLVMLIANDCIAVTVMMVVTGVMGGCIDVELFGTKLA